MNPVDSNSISNGDDSQEERIQWLRERGVQIEFPEERKEKNRNVIKNDQTNAENFAKVTIVKIPCKITDPYIEIEVMVPKLSDNHSQYSSTTDGLLEALKPFFTPVTDGMDEKSLKEAVSSNLSLSGQPLPEVSLSSLTKMGGNNTGSVEAFTLCHPTESNKFVAVNLYLDEVGQLKHLPTNERAVQLAATCGFDHVPLVGDMFIGRIQKYQGIKHMDFRLSDLNSDAEWLKNIKSNNYQYGLATNRVAMSTDVNNDNVPKVHDNITKGYKWTETTENVEIIYSLPKDITSKMIKVDFLSKKIVIKRKGKEEDNNKGNNLLLSIDLYGSISIDDSTWTSSGQEIEITLQKSTSVLWRQLEPS